MPKFVILTVSVNISCLELVAIGTVIYQKVVQCRLVTCISYSAFVYRISGSVGHSADQYLRPKVLRRLAAPAAITCSGDVTAGAGVTSLQYSLRVSTASAQPPYRDRRHTETACH